jgi:adenine-specific DNA-methyltransferase
MPYEINRTELVWPGKYDEEGKRREVDRVSMPFQVIERVNESRATREADKARNPTLFDVWQGDSAETFEEGWRNKLIWGENKLVMSSLFEQFAGKIDLIYIDPPFATGADFSFIAEIGDGVASLTKAQSLIEEKAYRDTWGSGLTSYLDMMVTRLVLIRELLADSGVLYLHAGPDVSSYLRVACDEVFGSDAFLNEIIWKRTPFSGSSKALAKKFPVNHDSILFYAKRRDTYAFQHIYDEYSDEYKARFKYEDDRGFYRKTLLKTYSKATEERLKAEDRWIPPVRSNAYPSYKQYLHESKGRQVEDIWSTDSDEVNDGAGNVWEDLNLPNPMAEERTGYATQKPEVLLERIIRASSTPGSLVADFFVGSGTTAAVAEKLDRRWIAVDLGRYAVHTTRKRMLSIPGCKPFEVLNLGKYERSYWQVSTFGEDLDNDGVIALYEYVAFILKLYGATPATGLANLHGKIGRAFVHVGAVDSPVTIDEIVACVDECIALKARELHILGWEWEMGLHDPMTDEAKSRGIQLVLRQIPREVMEHQAAAKGDVAFFELAYLDVEIVPRKSKREMIVKLKDFVIPNPELVPEDIRSKIKKWSDYVDYWAVDWTFADDTFIQGWVTYRTRKNRGLALESDPHTFELPGEYAVMVKVIDIFGNDTSKIVRVKVS